MYYGLDDSQRPFNKNNKFLREIGVFGITLHFLYSEYPELCRYIWTLGQPQKEHGIFIANFLSQCDTDDIVYACSHYSIYPQLKNLDVLKINGWEKRSKESYLYSRANHDAKQTSLKILNAIENGKSLDGFLERYFGDRELLEFLLNERFRH